MNKYKEQFIEYNNFLNTLTSANVPLDELNKYETLDSLTTRNLRIVVYELLEEELIAKEELDKKLGYPIGTLDMLLTKGIVELQVFNDIFEYFEIPNIYFLRERFSRYIIDYS